MNFNKNKLINKTLEKYYYTYSMTLDTGDFVPEKTNQKIYRYIDKNLNKIFSQIDKEDKKFQKRLKKQNKQIDKFLNYQNKLKIKEIKTKLRVLKTKKKKKKQSFFVCLKNNLRYHRLKRKHLLLDQPRE